MENKETLIKMAPVRMVIFAWIPVFIWFILPSANWTILIKIVLGVMEFLVLSAAFSKTWRKYETFGAFVTLNVLWLVLMFIIKEPFWIHYILGFIIVTGFGTMFSHIDKVNKTTLINK